MTLNERIRATIQELFGKSELTPEAVETFKDAKSADGQILKITPDIAEGATVEVVSEDGSTAPAGDGDITLEDGTVINVAGGKIATVMVAEAPEEQPMEAAPAESEVKDSTADTTKMSEFEQRLGNLEEAVNMLVDGLKKQHEGMSKATEKDEEVEKLKTELAKLKSAPAVSFKAIEKTETKNTQPISDMQKRIQGLAK